MILNEIQQALDTRLTFLGITEVAWEGVAYIPSTDVPYVSAKVSSRISPTVGVGPFVPRMWSGTYTILVCFPEGEGMAAVYDQANLILNNFNRGLTLAAGARSLIVEGGSIAPSYTAADWVHVPVTIEWFCEEL